METQRRLREAENQVSMAFNISKQWELEVYRAEEYRGQKNTRLIYLQCKEIEQRQ